MHVTYIYIFMTCCISLLICVNCFQAQPKYLKCIAVSCFYLASKICEEENVSQIAMLFVCASSTLNFTDLLWSVSDVTSCQKGHFGPFDQDACYQLFCLHNTCCSLTTQLLICLHYNVSFRANDFLFLCHFRLCLAQVSWSKRVSADVGRAMYCKWRESSWLSFHGTFKAQRLSIIFTL